MSLECGPIPIIVQEAGCFERSGRIQDWVIPEEVEERSRQPTQPCAGLAHDLERAHPIGNAYHETTLPSQDQTWCALPDGTARRFRSVFHASPDSG